MAAALTIAVIFMVSFTVVRIAAVAMRLTGLPETVARLQCLSALTGTGFTTSESEMIVNYPVRRRILGLLMVTGNLGLASVAATLIVSLVDTEPRAGAIAWQAAMMAIAVAIVVTVMSRAIVDRAMCGLIGKILLRTTTLGKRHYHRVLQVDTGYSVTEHQYRGARTLSLTDLPAPFHDLQLLAKRGEREHLGEDIADDAMIMPGDILVCYGHDDVHERFAEEFFNPS